MQRRISKLRSKSAAGHAASPPCSAERTEAMVLDDEEQPVAQHFDAGGPADTIGFFVRSSRNVQLVQLNP